MILGMVRYLILLKRILKAFTIYLNLLRNIDKDIIYIGVSSGLSGTYNSANIGKTAILEEFPNARIYIIDAVNGVPWSRTYGYESCGNEE